MPSDSDSTTGSPKQSSGPSRDSSGLGEINRRLSPLDVYQALVRPVLRSVGRYVSIPNIRRAPILTRRGLLRGSPRPRLRVWLLQHQLWPVGAAIVVLPRRA
jgi:hypothetical protein